jgi:small-conductance mechanosensitive channel
MNNGFNGTGTAFILYIVLAFCMPFVYVYRLTRRRKDFGYRFVIGHFMLGIIVTTLAVLCVGYLWRMLALSKHGYLHEALVAMAYMAVITVLTWILIPRLVRLSYRLRRKREMLHYKNPHIQPWFTQHYSLQPQKFQPKHLAIDIILPRKGHHHP